MQLFTDLSRGAYLVLSLIIGLRLLWLYRGTRQLPELLMAVSLLCGGVLYNGYGWAWARTSFPPPEYAELLSDLMRPMLAISAIAVAVFAWRTSRRDAVWALLLVLLLSGAMLVWLADGWLQGPTLDTTTTPWLARGLSLLAAYVWAATESLLYYRNARRRRRIGLRTDPQVVNQAFFLGLGFASFAVYWSLEVLFQVNDRPPPFVVLGALGLVRTFGIWLAFLPPAAFTRWLRRHANVIAEEGA